MILLLLTLHLFSNHFQVNTAIIIVLIPSTLSHSWIYFVDSQTYGATGSSPASHTTVIITNPNPAETIFLVGGCPACRVGVLDDEFTFLGLLCFILFFPIVSMIIL